MSLEAVCKSVQQCIPSREQVINKFSVVLPRIARNTSTIAIPAITLFALTNLPVANAGPFAYGICTAYCAAFATPVLLPACLVACIPVGAAPTP
ncbi:MAG: hypothetical protein KBA81_04155 [Rhabdochlamydiaceae bacterium]|nr:hypothetical protein [Rhabdochlamydiaceae bacterium]